MKTLWLLLICLVSSSVLPAQDSWKLTLHKKLLLTGSGESTVVKQIRSSDWKKSGYLEVQYKTAQSSNFQYRMRLTDEMENEIWGKDSTRNIKLSTTTLRKLFAGKKQIKIFMVILPPNPMMAMPARQVLLATLKLP